MPYYRTAAAISDYAWISIAPEQLDEREVLPRIEAFEQFIANQQDGSARALGKNCAAMARFKLALSRADLSGALAIAESQQQRGQNDIAGIMYLRLGDTRAEQAFTEAALTARYRLWDWFYWTTMLTPELRRNSLLFRHEARMGGPMYGAMSYAHEYRNSHEFQELNVIQTTIHW